MAVTSYVIVSTDPSNKTILDGPILWDGVTPLAAPAGMQFMDAAAAKDAGYTYPPPSNEAANLATLLAKAQTALANDIAYVNLASPTNAQAVGQVTALTRQMIALIRLTLNSLDTLTGT